MFCKRSVLKHFAKFTGKHLCQSLIFNKVGPVTLLKKRPWRRYFPTEIIKTSIFYRTLPVTASKFPENLRPDFLVIVESQEDLSQLVKFTETSKMCRSSHQEVFCKKDVSCEFCEIF